MPHLDSLSSMEESLVSPQQQVEETKRISGVVSPYVIPDQMTVSKGIASRADPAAPAVTGADQPHLYPPKLLSSEEANEAINKLKEVQWFSPSFLANFIAVMQEIANYERLNQFQDSMAEVKMRDYLFQLAKATSDLTKQLYEQQSAEKMAEAFSSFTSAFISGVQFVATVKNFGDSTAKVEKKINEKKRELNTAIEKEFNEGRVSAGNTLPTQQTMQLPQPGPARDQAIADYRANEPNKPPKVKELEKELKKMENSRESDILQWLHHEDQKMNSITEALKHTITAVKEIYVSKIKLQEGEIDSLKQLLEGFIQAFNKYLETLSRGRDDAKAAFDRNYYEFTNRIIEKTFGFQLLSHSGG